MFEHAPQVHSVVTDLDDVQDRLEEIVHEMDYRYELFEGGAARNIDDWNNDWDIDANQPMHGGGALPYIVVVIDELADLMIQRKKTVEPLLIRIAQLGRAAGIHLVLATQRPTRDVITGLIKANVPSRWTFAVTSTSDSMVVLDQPGASALIGKGDSLWFPAGAAAPERVQGYQTPNPVLADVLQWAIDEWPEMQGASADFVIEDEVAGYMSAEDAIQEGLDRHLTEVLAQPVHIGHDDGTPEGPGLVVSATDLAPRPGDLEAVLGNAELERQLSYLTGTTAIVSDLVPPDEAYVIDGGSLLDPVYATDGARRIVMGTHVAEKVKHRKRDVDSVYEAGSRIGEKVAGWIFFGAAAGIATGLTIFVLNTIFGG